MSNLTQLKNSIDIPPIKNCSTKYQSKENISISASSVLSNESAHELPRSRAFSSNFIGISSDALSFRN
jgi:hypothetical protein